MASVGKKFVGAGAAHTSDAVEHAGGDVQLLVTGDPGGANVWLEKQFAFAAPEYREVAGSRLRYEGGLIMTLKACSLKVCVSAQSEDSDFGYELITV